MTDNRFIVTCNGRKVPLRSTPPSMFIRHW